MTCIVGIVGADGRVVIGGDSAGVSGWDLTVRADSKVFRTGPFVIGFTTSFRMGQLLRWKLKATLPEHPDGMSDEEFMCTLFVDAVRECLKAGGYATKKDEVEQGGTFLVGYRGGLWRVEGDYQVGRSVAPFMAVGCGNSYACGALAALDQSVAAEERVLAALAIAERFSVGVRGPFCYVKEGDV